MWRFAREQDAAWERERLLIVLLNAKQKVIGAGEIPLTGLTAGHVRKVLKGVPLSRGAAIISVHNQPRANPRPSRTDQAVAKRLEEIADEVGVPILDHLVFSGGRYFSLAERKRVRNRG